MTLLERLREQLRTAIRARDEAKIRQLRAQIDKIAGRDAGREQR